MVDKELCEVNHRNINEKIDRLEKKHIEDMGRLEQRVSNTEDTYEAMFKLTFEMSQMRKDVNNILTRVVELESKPAKKWETVSTYVMLGIIGIAIGFIAAAIGLR